MATQVETSQGIVIALRNTGERDRVVEIISGSHGRMALFAAGARMSRKRFGGQLDVFAHVNFSWTPRAFGMAQLTEARAIDLHEGLRTRYIAVLRASRMLRCARALTDEGEPTEGIFSALVAGLGCLDRGDEVGAMASYPVILRAAGLDMEGCDAVSTDTDLDDFEHTIASWIERHTGMRARCR